MHRITRYGKKLEGAIIEEARKNDKTSSDEEQNGLENVDSAKENNY